MITTAPRRRGQFPSMFDEFFNDINRIDFPRASTAAVNVKETDKAFELEVSAPGMKKDQISIDLEEDTLIIQGQAESKSEESNEKYTRKEFSRQSFKRSFSLPKNEINSEEISANYEDGILKIVLPKLKEQANANPKKIEIK